MTANSSTPRSLATLTTSSDHPSIVLSGAGSESPNPGRSRQITWTDNAAAKSAPIAMCREPGLPWKHRIAGWLASPQRA